MLGLRVQRSIDRYDIADPHQRLDSRVVGNIELLLHRSWEPVPVGVVQFDVERL